MTRDPPNIGFDPACCLSLDTCSKSSQKLSWAASQLCQQGMSDTTGFPSKHKGTAVASTWCCSMCSSVQTASCTNMFRHHVTAFGEFGQARRDDFCAVIPPKCEKNTCCQLFWHFINDKSTLDVPGHRTKRDSFFASRSLSTITTLNEVNFRI